MILNYQTAEEHGWIAGKARAEEIGKSDSVPTLANLRRTRLLGRKLFYSQNRKIVSDSVRKLADDRPIPKRNCKSYVYVVSPFVCLSVRRVARTRVVKYQKILELGPLARACEPRVSGSKIKRAQRSIL